MPLDIKTDDTPAKFPNPDYLTLGNFKRGVITLINESNLPKNALVQADNILLIEDGRPTPRPGIQWYGQPITTTTTRLNQCQNPSFEVDVTSGGWLGAGTGSTLSRITSDFYVGVACAKFVNTTNNNSLGYIFTSVNGVTYTVQARMKATAGQLLKIDPSLMSAAAAQTFTATGGWDLVSYSFTSNTTSGEVLFGLGSGANQTFYVDAVLIEQTASVQAYFDGSLTNTSTQTYSWTGTANNSVSQLITTGVNPGPIDGFDYYDFGHAVHLVACAGGTVFRSTDDGTTWTPCTGATLTAGKEVNMVQYNSFLYLATGVDILARYNGTTTLQTYTVLTTPTAPSAAVGSGAVGTTYTTYYKVSAVSAVGFSIASAAVTVQTNKPRANFDATSNYVTLTLPAYQATQTRYDIYYSEDNLNVYYLDSQTTPNLTYVDNGSAILIPSTLAPTTNTTQGPTVAELSVIGNRLYGVRDPNFPYRIWFSSGSSPLGSFSDGYDGGYLDWQLGGKYFPVHVEDYHDGKGTSIATVWLDSADSQGAIIQMSLGTLTVGNLSVTVPSAYKLSGSRGTPAPHSVVNVLNDYYFYNSQAFYTLGNKPNLLQILSTDEVSANIRPTVRTINPTAASGICAEYFDAKIFISVPYGATSNNATVVYDTELQAWLPKAYTVGFKKFLRYTDTAGVHRLLAIKTGDNQLTELGTLYNTTSTIEGDYGQPIQTDLLTGLYSTQKDRYDFQFTEEMEYEFSNPVGTISIELLGIDHAKGYESVKTALLVTGSAVNTSGWDTFNWDSSVWDNTSVVPTPVSESSDKRYTVVNRELNAVQWHVSTSSLGTAYVLTSLQTWGTDTQDAHPSRWRITAQ